MSPVLRHASPTPAFVFDDDASPGARAVLRFLLRHAHVVDLAVSNIRLAALSFAREDLVGVRSARVLIAGFDNLGLLNAVDAAADLPAHAAGLAVLHGFLASGRLEIRSSGVQRWTPDFCIAGGPPLARWFPDGAASLIGNLGLGAAHPYRRPLLTSLLTGRRSIRTVRRGFERVWMAGHDIRAVVAEALAGVVAGSGINEAGRAREDHGGAAAAQ